MKVRTSFVSNSSTVSFCIFGIDLSPEEALELPTWSSKDLYGLDSFFPEPYSSVGLYIGKSWSKIGDNETGQQFKDNIKGIVKKLGFNPDRCRTIERAYQDDVL